MNIKPTTTHTHTQIKEKRMFDSNFPNVSNEVFVNLVEVKFEFNNLFNNIYNSAF